MKHIIHLILLNHNIIVRIKLNKVFDICFYLGDLYFRTVISNITLYDQTRATVGSSPSNGDETAESKNTYKF